MVWQKVKLKKLSDWKCPKCGSVERIDKVLCRGCFAEFEIEKDSEDSEKERLLNLLKYSQEAIDYWFNGCGDSPKECINENDHFKEEVKYFIEKLSK